MLSNNAATASIAIFSARETPEVLKKTVAAALRASTPETPIDVLVNGNRALADQITAVFRVGSSSEAERVRVWYLAQSDKANAWNQHIHHIWDGSSLAFYVDGYVELDPGAIDQLTRAMQAHPEAMAGTGVPSVGRSSKSLRQEMLTLGGMHGNFCCIRDSALLAFRSRGIRLPLGLYRTDSTMGAMLSFGLAPAQNEWNPLKYIAIAPDATWVTEAKKWWRRADIQASYKRLDRQAQGRLENKAVRHHLAVRQLPPEGLPRTAAELVIDWVARCPEEAAPLLRSDQRVERALDRLRTTVTDWHTEIAPVRIPNV